MACNKKTACTKLGTAGKGNGINNEDSRGQTTSNKVYSFLAELGS